MHFGIFSIALVSTSESLLHHMISIFSVSLTFSADLVYIYMYIYIYIYIYVFKKKPKTG